MSYPKVPIGELVSLRQGFAINKNTKHHISDEPTALPLLRIADMKDKVQNVFVKDTIPVHFIAKPEDIIYTRTGQVGLVFTDQYGVIHNNCFTVTPNDAEILDRYYLYYVLQSEDFYSSANNLASGAAQPDLPHGAFRSIEIPVPPLASQKRISEILKNYDNLIENNQKQIKLLEEAAQRLYKEWFVNLRFPGYETTPITDGIPKGWQYKPLSDVFEFVRGKSYTSKELSDTNGVLMANLKNIRAFGGYKRNAEKRFTGQFKENQTIAAGDVIMGVTDMTQERRLVGYVALVPDMGETMTFSMDLIKIIPKMTDKLFIYSALYYGGISKQISPLANGVNVLHLKPEAMMGIEILIPCDAIVKKYHLQVAPIIDRIEALQKQCDIASEARDRLLPKLMNGEIEV